MIIVTIVRCSKPPKITRGPHIVQLFFVLLGRTWRFTAWVKAGQVVEFLVAFNVDSGILVGGLEHDLYFSIYYIENTHPN